MMGAVGYLVRMRDPLYMIPVNLLVVGVDEGSCPIFVKKPSKRTAELNATLASFWSVRGIRLWS
jgi:hypothetical protein